MRASRVLLTTSGETLTGLPNRKTEMPALTNFSVRTSTAVLLALQTITCVSVNKLA